MILSAIGRAVDRENLSRDLARASMEQILAGEATAAQIALAWLLAKKSWIVPIPGSTKLARINENLGAAEVEMTAEDLIDLDHAKITIQGARLPEQILRMSE